MNLHLHVLKVPYEPVALRYMRYLLVLSLFSSAIDNVEMVSS